MHEYRSPHTRCKEGFSPSSSPVNRHNSLNRHAARAAAPTMHSARALNSPGKYPRRLSPLIQSLSKTRAFMAGISYQSWSVQPFPRRNVRIQRRFTRSTMRRTRLRRWNPRQSRHRSAVSDLRCSRGAEQGVRATPTLSISRLSLPGRSTYALHPRSRVRHRSRQLPTRAWAERVDHRRRCAFVTLRALRG